MTVQELTERAAKVLGWTLDRIAIAMNDDNGEAIGSMDAVLWARRDGSHVCAKSELEDALTNLNILLPEVDRWCGERGWEFRVTSFQDVGDFDSGEMEDWYRAEILVDWNTVYEKGVVLEQAKDRVTAILKVLVAAGGGKNERPGSKGE
jgi:hypothetical protein